MATPTLCVVAMTGSYDYSQRCWLFDPKKRVFVRESDLDALSFVEVHPATPDPLRRPPHRGAGVQRFRVRLGEKGKLVVARTEQTILGQSPKGKPLPPGFAHWTVRYERRGGRLVKVFDGPERAKP